MITWMPVSPVPAASLHRASLSPLYLSCTETSPTTLPAFESLPDASNGGWLAIASSEEIAFAFLIWLVFTHFHHEEGSHPFLEGVQLKLQVRYWIQELFSCWLPEVKKKKKKKDPHTSPHDPESGKTRKTSTINIYWAHCKRPWRINNFHPGPQMTLAPTLPLDKTQMAQPTTASPKEQRLTPPPRTLFEQLVPQRAELQLTSLC